MSKHTNLISSGMTVGLNNSKKYQNYTFTSKDLSLIFDMSDRQIRRWFISEKLAGKKYLGNWTISKRDLMYFLDDNPKYLKKYLSFFTKRGVA